MMEIEVEPVVLKHYEIQKRLGKGAYGIVWKAKNKRNGVTVALKKIFDAFRNQTDAQRTFREISFLQEFAGHPNIIRLLNVIRADNDKDIYLVFEYMETDLNNCIKKGDILKEVHKKYIFYQLLRAVKFIHSANVIHRDLKPSNVLLDSDCLAKLCDFGLTRSLSGISYGNGDGTRAFADGPEDAGDPGLTEYVATRWYRAPEILLASNRYTKFVDMWSLGCILGEMLAEKPLFPGTSTINQIERIVAVVPRPSAEDIACLHSDYGVSVLERALQKPSSTLESLFPHNVDKEGFDLVSKLLQLNPNKRPTVDEAIRHPYVQRFRDPASEIIMGHVVTPPLSDDRQLSVSDYRTKLYEIILEKKAQRRIRRLMRFAEMAQTEQEVEQTQPSSKYQPTPSRSPEVKKKATEANDAVYADRYYRKSPEKATRKGVEFVKVSPKPDPKQTNNQDSYFTQYRSNKAADAYVNPYSNPRKQILVDPYWSTANGSHYNRSTYVKRSDKNEKPGVEDSKMVSNVYSHNGQSTQKSMSYSRGLDNPVILRDYSSKPDMTRKFNQSSANLLRSYLSADRLSASTGQLGSHIRTVPAATLEKRMTSTMLLTSNGKRRGRKPGLNSTVAQRSAANARERSRMRVLSGAFVELKGALPWVPKDTKLSKLDTLKLAAGYIAYLRRILDTSSDSDDNPNESDSVQQTTSTSNPLQLLSLVAQTAQNSKQFFESERTVTGRFPVSDTVSNFTDQRLDCSANLTSPYFTLSSTPSYANRMRIGESKEIQFGSSLSSHSTQSFASHRDSSVTDSAMPYEDPNYIKDSCNFMPREASCSTLRQSEDTSRPVAGINVQNFVPPYEQDTVLNTELSRLLRPSIEAAWNHRPETRMYCAAVDEKSSRFPDSVEFQPGSLGCDLSSITCQQKLINGLNQSDAFSIKAWNPTPSFSCLDRTVFFP
ncbi:unnamed protein product [Calicophoron daubneyi]|uniref:Mitogen-activated protein kinase n=1 Tax=Calicophoron daubneyi TaxID=300641 RepID=A0AAV2T8P5_CALDB